VSTHRESFRPNPTGEPLQGIKNKSQIIPKISIERLVALVEYFKEWQDLPNISPWVLHTTEKVTGCSSIPSPEIQQGGVDCSRPSAGSGIPARLRVWVLQLLLHSSQEGLGMRHFPICQFCLRGDSGSRCSLYSHHH